MQVDRIDHVHIEGRDRDAAADWYARVLGLSRDPQLAAWADDPMGPLILSAGDGAPALPLFARDCAAPTRDATIAFGSPGRPFAPSWKACRMRTLSGVTARGLRPPIASITACLIRSISQIPTAIELSLQPTI